MAYGLSLRKGEKMQTKRGYCKECGKNVLLQKEQCNHIFHLLLSIITYGFWALVWINIAWSRKWRCPRCGSVCKPENKLDDWITKKNAELDLKLASIRAEKEAKKKK